MKNLALLILVVIIGQIASAKPVDANQYAPGDCIRNLLEVLGPNYTYISHDTVTRLEKNGDLTVFNAKGVSVRVQSNGGCYPVKNKADDYMGTMLGAYIKAKKLTSKEQTDKDYKLSEETGDPIVLQGHPNRAIESCDAQEKNADWYYMANQLGPKLKSPSDSGH